MLLHGQFIFLKHHPGCTWYELYLLTVALTDRPTEHIASAAAKAVKSIVHILNEFAVEVAKLIKFAVDTPLQKVFMAAKS